MADDARSGARSGRCLCGAVAFTARITGHEMDACHCSMCRRWSGGPFMCVGVADLSFVATDALGTYRSSGHGERLFCRNCGSILAWRMQDGSFTSVSAHAFDEDPGLPLKVEIFVDEQPDTYAFAGETNRMTGAEVIAAFAGKDA